MYIFGVFTGASLRTTLRALKQAGVTHRNTWGFDSFRGLPDENIQYRKAAGAWVTGQFSTSRLFGANVGPAEAAAALQRRLVAEGVPGAERVAFVEGFYNESLTPRLASARGMAPALYVDLDVDLYTSTRSALCWLLDRRLLPKGATVYYDDWGAGGETGQKRAHRECIGEHGANATEVPYTRKEGPGTRVYHIVSSGSSARDERPPPSELRS